jgi:hypothetical protein
LKAKLEAFLNLRLPLPGLTAWGARLSDRTVTSHSFTSGLNSRQLDQTVGKLTMAMAQLADHQIKPVRMCWVFEHLRIHVGVRNDGSCLALYVENNPSLATTALEGVLEEYINDDTL